MFGWDFSSCLLNCCLWNGSLLLNLGSCLGLYNGSWCVNFSAHGFQLFWFHVLELLLSHKCCLFFFAHFRVNCSWSLWLNSLYWFFQLNALFFRNNFLSNWWCYGSCDDLLNSGILVLLLFESSLDQLLLLLSLLDLFLDGHRLICSNLSLSFNFRQSCICLFISWSCWRSNSLSWSWAGFFIACDDNWFSCNFWFNWGNNDLWRRCLGTFLSLSCSKSFLLGIGIGLFLSVPLVECGLLVGRKL